MNRHGVVMGKMKAPALYRRGSIVAAGILEETGRARVDNASYYHELN